MADQHLCGVRLPGAGQCCVRQSGRLCLCQAEVQGQELPVQPDSDRHDDPVPGHPGAPVHPDRQQVQ